MMWVALAVLAAWNIYLSVQTAKVAELIAELASVTSELALLMAGEDVP